MAANSLVNLGRIGRRYALRGMRPFRVKSEKHKPKSHHYPRYTTFREETLKVHTLREYAAEWNTWVSDRFVSRDCELPSVERHHSETLLTKVQANLLSCNVRILERPLH